MFSINGFTWVDLVTLLIIPFYLVTNYYIIKEGIFSISMPSYIKKPLLFVNKTHLGYFFIFIISIIKMFFKKYFQIEGSSDAEYHPVIKTFTNLNFKKDLNSNFILSFIFLILSFITILVVILKKKNELKVVSYFFLLISSITFNSWLSKFFLVEVDNLTNYLSSRYRLYSISYALEPNNKFSYLIILVFVFSLVHLVRDLIIKRKNK